MPFNIKPFLEKPDRTPNSNALMAFLSYMLLDACPYKGGEVELKLVASVYESEPAFDHHNQIAET
jgi:hypothetical protein